jgi:hypothetical protein
VQNFETILGLRPRVSDMKDGTFRPEAVIRNTGRGDIKFAKPLPTIEKAEKSARALCEQIGGDGVWDGEWYAVAINLHGVWGCLETARVLLSEEMATPLGKRLRKELDAIKKAVAAAITAVDVGRRPEPRAAA